MSPSYLPMPWGLPHDYDPRRPFLASVHGAHAGTRLSVIDFAATIQDMNPACLAMVEIPRDTIAMRVVEDPTTFELWLETGSRGIGLTELGGRGDPLYDWRRLCPASAARTLELQEAGELGRAAAGKPARPVPARSHAAEANLLTNMLKMINWTISERAENLKAGLVLWGINPGHEDELMLLFTTKEELDAPQLEGLRVHVRIGARPPFEPELIAEAFTYTRQRPDETTGTPN